jgi:alpha-L-rhamnosidase
MMKARLFLVTVILFTACIHGKMQPSIDDLMVEFSRTPLGIDVEKPRFSWKMTAQGDSRGNYQHAFRIVVSDPVGDTVWDTDRIETDISLGITYAGLPLKPATRYKWSVKVWDQGEISLSNSSWFETGLMNPDQSAWEGAQWIGTAPEDIQLNSHSLSVFTLEYSLRLDETSGSTRAGFVIGANDHRLLNKYMNVYGLESKRNNHYIKFVLDLSRLGGTEDGLARFHIYRVGYAPEDRQDLPFRSIDIPKSLISLKNKYETHQITIESVFGLIQVFINGKSKENRIGKAGDSRLGRSGINVNPMGVGGDYISFPMLADIGFSLDAGQKAKYSDIQVRNYRKPSNILYKDSVMELDGGKMGVFMVEDPSRNAMPMLRTSFKIKESEIRNARLYVTARGIYEIYLNGQRVGDDWFNPGLTQYNKTHLYQCYDVSNLVKSGGENVLGAWLGEGWWSGNYTFFGTNWNFFGDRQSLLAKLVITYADGSTRTITSNDEEWSYYNDGPVRYGSMFQGEVYDARKEAEIKGWTTPGYEDVGWNKVHEIDLEGTAYLDPPEYDNYKLIGQIGETARIIKELCAHELTEVRPGVYVYDMGQNMVGIPKIGLTGGTPGDTIRLRFAEVLYPDMDEYQANKGMVMLENIRAAHAQDVYILKEGENVIQPRFTFHGYRYVEITGINNPLPLDSVRGLVISSINELSASYRTSNPKVNRLFENIVWSQYGNFLSIPTDCPQRNERMGWSGDLSVFSRTSTYLANVDQFFRRHLFAMRDLQYDDGRYPDVAPVDNGFGGILWGSAGITVAWEAYQQFGDKGLLEEHYESMNKYMEFLHGRIDNKSGVLRAGMLGDWLSPEGRKNDNKLLFSAYYIFNLSIMTQVAALLGDAAAAAMYQNRFKEHKIHFNDTYFDPLVQKTKRASSRSRSTTIRYIDSQASYAVPLALGAYSETNAPLAARRLAEIIQSPSVDDSGIEHPPYSLMTGFIGTAWISKGLSDYGYSDIAYRLLQQEDYPSWLYPVTQGATTIWERLNSYTEHDGFGGNNSMNSFNHYSFGAVGQWMMAYSLGIEREQPGFKTFILQPEPDPGGHMNWAEGYYDSMYGRIKSSWRQEDDTLFYKTTVPANTSATLFLPAKSAVSVKENGIPAAEATGIRYLGFENKKAVYRLQSGTYTFESVQ